MQPVTSAIVNNGNPLSNSQHEYNASLTMNNITETQFQTLISTAKTKSAKEYDLNDYNCANYALDVINSIRPTDPIKSVNSVYNLYVPPASYAPVSFTESPQGLYKRFIIIKNNLYPDAANIETLVVKYATNSNGECNL